MIKLFQCLTVMSLYTIHAGISSVMFIFHYNYFSIFFVQRHHFFQVFNNFIIFSHTASTGNSILKMLSEDYLFYGNVYCFLLEVAFINLHVISM